MKAKFREKKNKKWFGKRFFQVDKKWNIWKKNMENMRKHRACKLAKAEARRNQLLSEPN